MSIVACSIWQRETVCTEDVDDSSSWSMSSTLSTEEDQESFLGRGDNFSLGPQPVAEKRGRRLWSFEVSTFGVAPTIIVGSRLSTLSSSTHHVVAGVCRHTAHQSRTKGRRRSGHLRSAGKPVGILGRIRREFSTHHHRRTAKVHLTHTRAHTHTCTHARTRARALRSSALRILRMSILRIAYPMHRRPQASLTPCTVDLSSFDPMKPTDRPTESP